MQALLRTEDIVELESRLVACGIAEDELMLRAGTVVATQAASLVESGSVIVLCGMGKNGGDGWVVADRLAAGGVEVSVVTAATPALMKDGLARRMASRATDVGIPVHVDPSPDELESLLSNADVVVDALFGTGFHGSMPEPYSTWAALLESSFEGAVIAIDVPSGVDANTGECPGAHVNADMTVTMFAVKPGLVSGGGSRSSGQVAVAVLASEQEGMPHVDEMACAQLVDDADLAGCLPPIDPQADKYARGRVLVVAGSTRYPGAAVMAARAASRAGAGYVTLAVPRAVVPVAQAFLLDVPVVGLPDDEEGALSEEAADAVRGLAAHADVVLAGPGLTVSFGACETVRALLESPCTLVLDADALNAVVKQCLGSVVEHPQELRRSAPLVLTPHRRELARLVGAEAAEARSLAWSIEAAQSLAWSVGSGNIAVVAKGPETAVVGVDGALALESGPAALATAGSGDVLGGMIAGTLACACASYGPDALVSLDLLRILAAVDRAHAVAGELAVRARGTRGVVAEDLVTLVGNALDEFEARCEAALDSAGWSDDEAVLEGDWSDLADGLEEECETPEESDTVPPEEPGLSTGEAAGEVNADEPEPVGADLDGEGPAQQEEVVAPVKQSEVGGNVKPFVPASPLLRRSSSTLRPPKLRDGILAGAPTSVHGRKSSPASQEPSAPQRPIVPPDLTLAEPAVDRACPAEASLAAQLTLAEPETHSEDRPSAAPNGASVPEVVDSAGAGLPPFLSRQAVPAVLTAFDLDDGGSDDFHERATLIIDDEGAPPIEDRPSAKARRARQEGKK